MQALNVVLSSVVLTRLDYIYIVRIAHTCFRLSTRPKLEDENVNAYVDIIEQRQIPRQNIYLGL